MPRRWYKPRKGTREKPASKTPVTKKGTRAQTARVPQMNPNERSASIYEGYNTSIGFAGQAWSASNVVAEEFSST